jgi:hypothetical protein
MGFVPGVARVVILFQQTRELVPIEPPPACPQAGEKFEFAAGENRHENACLGPGPTAEVEHHVVTRSGGHHFLSIPAYSLPL